MKKAILIFVFIIQFFIIVSHLAAADESVFKKSFAGLDGCMVIYNISDDILTQYNPSRCSERLSPCSTFKIFNALASLDSGVHKDENSLLKYDGSSYPFESWEKDHTLLTAMQNSVVWYYQRTAQMIGKKRMQEYINKTGYGNNDISGGITEFWLNSSLKISALEQVNFLRYLYRGNLPFNKHAQETVKKIITLSTDESRILSGKTGSWRKDGKWVLGWFVGHVICNGKEYVFAVNIKGNDGCNGAKAKEIAIKILKAQFSF